MPRRHDVAFWATSDLSMTAATRKQVATEAVAIAEYHRGLKQCGGEKCPARRERCQRNPILYAVRAFARLERQRLETDRRWYERKQELRREAIRAYRASRTLTLATTA